MSKLTDIKRRIDELDGGAFQNLCDTYLCYKGYGNGYSLGMSTGTNKTAKGNPDTYFLTADNKYVFVKPTTRLCLFIISLNLLTESGEYRLPLPRQNP